MIDLGARRLFRASTIGATVYKIDSGTTPVAPAIFLPTALDTDLATAMAVGTIGITATMAITAIGIMAFGIDRGGLPPAGDTGGIATPF